MPFQVTLPTHSFNLSTPLTLLSIPLRPSVSTGNDDFIQAIPDYVTEQEIAAMQLGEGGGGGVRAVTSTTAAVALPTSSGGGSSSGGVSTTASTSTTTSSSSSSGGALPLASTVPPPPQPPHKPPPVASTLPSKPQSSTAAVTGPSPGLSAAGPSPGQTAVPPPPAPPSIPPPKASSSSAATASAATGAGAASGGAGAGGGGAPLSAEMMMSINKVITPPLTSTSSLSSLIYLPFSLFPPSYLPFLSPYFHPLTSTHIPILSLYQVANFCVSNGVKAMSMLKGKDKVHDSTITFCC